MSTTFNPEIAALRDKVEEQHTKELAEMRGNLHQLDKIIGATVRQSIWQQEYDFSVRGPREEYDFSVRGSREEYGRAFRGLKAGSPCSAQIIRRAFKGSTSALC